MNTDYRSPAIRAFRDIQLQSTSRAQKLEQIDRAEQLLTGLEVDRAYSPDHIFRELANSDGAVLATTTRRLSAEDVGHDLQLLVEDISDAAAVPIESAGERVMTADELSKLFDVSTKTITRWRRRGLVGRKFVVDGRKRMGFLKSSVDRFVARNQERVRRGSRFRQVTEDERVEIVSHARRLCSEGCAMNEVANRLASLMNRSPGTIRGVIKQYDRENPDQGVFPDVTSPLTDDVRDQVYHRYRDGESVDSLAERYQRTKTTIYRIIGKKRYARIVNLPLDFIPNSRFSRIRDKGKVLGPMPVATTPSRKPRMPKDLPRYLASLYEVPLLSREQEQHLFRKFNYVKYCANRLRKQLDAERPQARLMDEIERLYDIAVSTKNQIVRANLRLVVSIAKRHVGQNEDFFELVSDGNISLIRAVEKFDFSRGFKFSTYASWAIMKNFARSIPNEMKRRDRFRTSHEETFSMTEENRGDWFGQESAQNQRVREVARILNRLDDREQKIIIHRFGLDYSREPQTLKQVGEEMGVTKERVRQIEARALNKLRVAAAEEQIELPDGV
jgi:RNA polymerase primary sigma factor/RNA polymerase sigma factor